MCERVCVYVVSVYIKECKDTKELHMLYIVLHPLLWFELYTH